LAESSSPSTIDFAARVSTPAAKPLPKARMSPRRRSEVRWGFIFAAPAIIGFLMLKAVPILFSLWIALTDWTVVGTAHWIGLANFQKMLTADPIFWRTLSVTAYYTLLSVPASMVFAFFLATLLNNKIPGLGIFRTIFYIPSIVPIIATSVIWLWMYNPDFGLFNSLLRPLGFPKLQWIFGENSVVPSLVFMSIWGVGPMMIIFLAGLQDVPKELYEAADIDGASGFHKLIHITVPMMTPTILFNLMISLVAAFQTFVQPYVMTNGGPNNGSLFFVFFIYRTAFQDSRMGYASALAWALFVIISLLSFLIFRNSKRWVYYHGSDA
jgi:multiple sugar transport system permease protein